MADMSSLEGLSADEITRLAIVAKGVLTHPDTRAPAQRLIKKIDPAASFPEIDIADQLAKQREDFQAEIAARDKKEAEKESARARKEELTSLVAGGVLRPEDVTIDPEKRLSPIEEYMVKNQISNYATAARLYRLEQQPAPATTNSFLQAPSSPTLPTIDLSGKNLKQWSNDVAYETFNDLKTGKLRVNEMGVPIS